MKYGKIDRQEGDLYNSVRKIDDYLYTIEYDQDKLDYEYAHKYYKEIYLNKDGGYSNRKRTGACSAIRNSNLLGRNFDWCYSNNNTYVIKVNAGKDDTGKRTYASLGVASDIIETDSEMNKFRLLPFVTLDGINEKGVVVEFNIVPVGDKGNTRGTNDDLDGEQISMVLLPRYILDHFATAKEAVEWIQEAKIYGSYGKDEQYEDHYLIADEKETYIVEFVNNEAKIIKADTKPYMTNFYIYEAKFEANGHIGYSGTTLHGIGLERYNIIVDNYRRTTTLRGMRDVLEKVKMSRYVNIDNKPLWYSEFVGLSKRRICNSCDELTLNTDKTEYESIIRNVKEAFKNRSRDKCNTYHTMHSSIYDIEKRCLHLVIQERDASTERIFLLNNDVVS